MKILVAGFKGNDNSAKILLDNIKEKNNQDILYLENDFEVSSNQIEEKMLQNYDYVLIFGQKPNTKNICLENNAVLEETKVETDFYYGVLKENLESNNYKVISSCDAGNYLCNNIFFRSLSFKQTNNLKSKIAFIHIPTIDNIDNIELLASTILNYINTLSDVFNVALLQLKVRAYKNMVGIVTVNYANHGGKSSAYSPIVRNINKHELNSEMLVMNEKEDIKIETTGITCNCIINTNHIFYKKFISKLEDNKQFIDIF